MRRNRSGRIFIISFVFMMFLLLYAMPAKSFAADGTSIVEITRPADGATVSVGEVPLYLTFNWSGGVSADVILNNFFPVTVEILKGNTTVSTQSISAQTGNIGMNGNDTQYATLTFNEAGTYTIRAKCPGSSSVWDKVTITVRKQNEGDSGDNGSGGSVSEGGYPQGTDPRSSMNSYEIPGAYAESQNPGYHLRLEKTEYTIDLAGSNTAHIGFQIQLDQQTESDFIFYCDWPEDQDKKIIKYKGMGDDYIEYTGVGVGTTKLHVYIMVNMGRYDHQVITLKVIDSSKPEVSGDGSSSSAAKNGTVFKAGGRSFKVTSKNTVSFTAGKNKSITRLTIPAAVKYQGKTYQVTAIAKGALSGYTKLKTLVIGKNVKKIGAKAFYGAKSLRAITIKSKQLTLKNVGKNAFKGVNKKAVFKAPSAKVKAYKTILKKRGMTGKTWKIKKI